jgi:hypothetical protein
MGDQRVVQTYPHVPRVKKTRKSSKDTTLKDLDGSLMAFMTILESTVAGLVRASYSYWDTADQSKASGIITHGSSDVRNTYCVRPYKAHAGTGDAHVCSRAIRDAVNEALNKAYIANARLGPVSGKSLLGLLKKTLRNLKQKDKTNARNNTHNNRKWPSIEGIELYGFFSEAFDAAVNQPESALLLANPWAPEDSDTEAEEVASTAPQQSAGGSEQFDFGSFESFGLTSKPFFYWRVKLLSCRLG